MRDLRKRLEASADALAGAWVALPRTYEAGFCKAVGATLGGDRYSDCSWGDTRLELKKTRSGVMWFDLVRYAEAFLNPRLAEDVVTLVLRYKLLPPTVTHVAAIAHGQLIDALRIDSEVAGALIRLQERVPRSLNAQAALAWSDISAAADFVLAVES